VSFIRARAAILRNSWTASHGLHRNGWDPRTREHLDLGAGPSGGLQLAVDKAQRTKDAAALASAQTALASASGSAVSSAVTKTETTTIAGIHPGDSVLAIGTAGKDGTVAATQVRVTPAATNS